ncbi:hypothetical protein C3729_01940 [Cloacibacterium normanense]|uniref:Uncharacterized protein n=1 Tax=Cloacibacterium normanense TaxID=237258 RepID=A0A2S7I899_9FLAO|nr:hypothetical protein [Cloacibacterium normanense]PPZ92792.1 hypothetical protein C3729_01940 [Cloacibacterium normanense]
MKENYQLQHLIDKLGLTKDDYLFLTIKTVYLYHMKSGEKTVEYRDPSDFIFSRLYDDYSKNNFSKPKKYSHILFQAGYNPDSPRMLVELKGWSHKGQNHPENLDTRGHDIDDWCVNLVLGKILYENLDMSREVEYNKREERESGQPRKSAKSKAALKSKLSNRRSKISGSVTRKK